MYCKNMFTYREQRDLIFSETALYSYTQLSESNSNRLISTLVIFDKLIGQYAIVGRINSVEMPVDNIQLSVGDIPRSGSNLPVENCFHKW